MSEPSRARAWSRLTRPLGGALGLGLVAAGLTAAPANALLDGLTPQIQGLGTITGASGYSCTNTDPVSSLTCAALPTELLSLGASPAAGYEFSGWASCASVSGTSCVLGLVSPVATFLPVDDTVPPLPPDPDGPLPGLPESPTDPTDPLPLPEIPIDLPGADTEAPETTLTGGPLRRGWRLGGIGKFRLTSSEESSTFTCTLNGKANPACAAGGDFVLGRLAQRTHLLKATATDAADNVDETPAVRTFTVPRNSAKLRHAPAWTKRKGRGHYMNSFSVTKKQGAVLTTRARGIKRIALVASRGKGHGTVEVYLGKRLLKTVPLQAKRAQKKRLIPIASFPKKRRGLVRVKVISAGKVVRIEGLGIASR